MKKELFVVLAVAVLGLAFLISACSISPHKTPKEAVELSSASVGDIVVFGDIRWYVIAKTETGFTLLSEKPVIKLPFREAGYQATNTWEDSTSRAWLNEDFYNSKFTDGEKAAIVTTHNTFTEADSHYEMDCGNDTDDKVYLFSYTESKPVSDDIRGCGINWWLRSPGRNQYDAVFVFAGTSWNLMGNYVDSPSGVRPSIRVRYSGQTKAK